VSGFGRAAAIAALRLFSALIHCGLEQTSRVASTHPQESPLASRHGLSSVHRQCLHVPGFVIMMTLCSDRDDHRIVDSAISVRSPRIGIGHRFEDLECKRDTVNRDRSRFAVEFDSHRFFSGLCTKQHSGFSEIEIILYKPKT
jgi:hypothetical protein